MNPSSKKLRRAVVIGVSLAFAGIAACGGDDNGAQSPYAGTPGPDATVPTVDGGDAGPTTAVLCAKYGGYSFVQKVATDIVSALSADCRIDYYFVSVPPDDALHFSDCLTQQLGTFFQCPGVTYSQDSKGQTCRSMSQAHQGLNLRSADFNSFVDDIVAAMQTDDVSGADIQSLIPTFLGLEGQIVAKQGSGNSQCTCAGLVYDGGSCGLPHDAGDGSTDGSPDSEASTAADSGGGMDAGTGVDAADSAAPADAAGE